MVLPLQTNITIFDKKNTVYEYLSPYPSQLAHGADCESHHQNDHEAEEDPRAVAEASQLRALRDVLKVGHRGGHH